MGFIMHFYIIFGTKLLTQSPVPISVFPLFQCFAEKEYQTESKRNETFGRAIFGTNVIQETWSGLQERSEEATRKGGTPAPLGRAPTLVGPSQLHRPTSSSYIYPYTLKPSGNRIDREFHHRKPLQPPKTNRDLVPAPCRRGIPHRWPSSSSRCSP